MWATAFSHPIAVYVGCSVLPTQNVKLCIHFVGHCILTPYRILRENGILRETSRVENNGAAAPL